MNHFANCTTVEAIKKLYRTLAMRWHPDRPGGDLETMQIINAQYHQALKAADGTQTKGDDDKYRTYTYNEETEEELIAKIKETIATGILNSETVDLYLVGVWLWAQGDTRPVKEELKSLGFRWHKQRSCWYWHNQPYRSFKSNSSTSSIFNKYGAAKVANGGRRQELEA